jgi:hypothetical protein
LGGDGSRPRDKKERGKKKRKGISWEGNRRKRIRMKIKTIIENRKKRKERALWTFHPVIHFTQLR